MTFWRIVRYRREFVADLFDHNRCVGFFTCVAAMCVMGNQFVIVVDRPQIAVGLWFVGLVLWFILTYTIFTILTVKRYRQNRIARLHRTGQFHCQSRSTAIDDDVFEIHYHRGQNAGAVSRSCIPGSGPT
jgi:hypothetical protein